MKIQKTARINAYNFADDAGDLTNTPVYLVLDEYVELLDYDDRYVTQEHARSERIDLSIEDARIMVAQLTSAIESVEKMLEEENANG